MQHFAFASYGNDSIAMIQWLFEVRIPNVTVVYSDTGWAADWWPQRVAEGEALAWSCGFQAVRIGSIGMEALVRSRKGWPFQRDQFCTTFLKIIPAQEWMDDVDPYGEATCICGVRAEESRERATSWREWTPWSERHHGRALWAPLLHHDEAMRNALILRAGFSVLPHRSAECWPCVNSNRADFLALSKDQNRVDRVAEIERSMGYTRNGKPRTMFRPHRHHGASGIHAVIDWARSGRKFVAGQMSLPICESGFCGM